MRVFSTRMSRSNENKGCMRVEKQEFVWEFSQLPCPGQTRTRVAWELISKSLHENFLNSHVPVKREELHESWEARVCMRVFSTRMSRSNENKSCMRVDKQEFAREFSQLACPGQTRTRVARELMRVDWTLPRNSETSYQLALKVEPVQSQREFMRADESWCSNASESCNFHQWTICALEKFLIWEWQRIFSERSYQN